MGVCFLTTNATARSTPTKGRGVFAIAPIGSGEVVAAFGGTCVTIGDFVRLPSDRQRHSVQIEDDVFMVGDADTEPADYINHSCEPNCGMSGNVVLIALRDIEVDEEITYDYAMSDGSAYDEFDCQCGAPSCRVRITGRDWELEQLQTRYRDHFSPYLARRIAARTKQT